MTGRAEAGSRKKDIRQDGSEALQQWFSRAAWSGGGVPAEAGEPGVHVRDDGEAVEPGHGKFGDEVRPERGVEGELAPVGHDLGVGREYAAVLREDPEAGAFGGPPH